MISLGRFIALLPNLLSAFISIALFLQGDLMRGFLDPLRNYDWKGIDLKLQSLHKMTPLNSYVVQGLQKK